MISMVLNLEIFWLISNVFFTDLVFINLSPLQKARDLSEASDLTKQDLTEQDILNEDQGVWIGSFQSNGRDQLSHN